MYRASTRPRRRHPPTRGSSYPSHHLSAVPSPNGGREPRAHNRRTRSPTRPKGPRDSRLPTSARPAGCLDQLPERSPLDLDPRPSTSTSTSTTTTTSTSTTTSSSTSTLDHDPRPRPRPRPRPPTTTSDHDHD